MSESPLPPENAALDEAAVEALLSGSRSAADPVTEVLDALRAEGRRFTPEPSTALVELFTTGLARDEFTRRRNRSRIVIGMLLAGGTTLGLSGVAAAHDALPNPAQSVVTDIVNGLTPFHIADDDRSPVPAPTDPTPHRRPAEPGDDSGRAVDPTPATSGSAGGAASGSGRGSKSGESGSGDSGSDSTSGGSGSASGSGGSGSDSSSPTSGSGGPDSGSGRDGGSGDSGSGRGGSDGGGSNDLDSGGSGSGGSDGGSDGGGSR